MSAQDLLAVLVSLRQTGFSMRRLVFSMCLWSCQRQAARYAMSKVSWRGIVKVQRSLFSSGVPPQVLIYSEDRAIHHQEDLDADLLEWFDESVGQGHKFFAQAEVRDTVVHLIAKVPWQDW